MKGDAISTGCYPEWNKCVCTSPAADRQTDTECAFIDVLGSHPPGMNALFWEIGTRKSLPAKIWMFPLSAKSEFVI